MSVQPFISKCRAGVVFTALSVLAAVVSVKAEPSLGLQTDIVSDQVLPGSFPLLNQTVTVKVVGNTGTAPWSRSLFNGLAQIIVQSTRDPGEIKLTATADGLAPATAAVKTQPCTPRPSMP